MKPAAAIRLAVVFSLPLLSVAKSHAAAEPSLDSLATCRDSWLDWKDDPTRGAKFTEGLRANYTYQQDRGGFLVPKAPKTLLGLPVARVYPESAGMAVGFTVLVNSGFEVAKKAVEKSLGKPLKCDPGHPGDEIFGCELELGPKKTVMVASEGKSSKSTLIGCYYFYEK